MQQNTAFDKKPKTNEELADLLVSRGLGVDFAPAARFTQDNQKKIARCDT